MELRQACVLTVARQQIAYLRIWRDGARALYRNERQKARRLFGSSLKISNAQAKVQPQCFAEFSSEAASAARRGGHEHRSYRP